MKNCDIGILNAITMIIDGTAPYGTQEMKGYASGAVGLAENDYYTANMTADEVALVKTFTDKVLNGETVVVDELATPGVFDTLYAQYGVK
jgi:basic membrane lipoprotein Med (substrate-binding protein (PBP1-ABC) superfamily)